MLLEKYEFTPLAEGEIRIIELQPAQEAADPIEVNIVVLPLARAVYTALSYTWRTEGSDVDEQNHEIYYWSAAERERKVGRRERWSQKLRGKGKRKLPDRSFLISHNLHDALSAIRNKVQVMRLWVDQICINQSDLDERQRQVKMMSLIFRKAGSVCAWISLSVWESIDLPRTVFYFNHLINERLPCYDRNSGGRKIVIDNIEDEWWFRLGKLIRNRYFLRTWVIQELVINRMALCCIGGEFIEFHYVSEVLIWMFNSPLKRGIFGPSIRPYVKQLNEIACIRQEFFKKDFRPPLRGHPSPRKWTIIDLMVNTWSARCQDQRDKVYSMMGILKDTNGFEDFEIDPDYTIGFYELTRDVFVRSLTVQRDFRMLTFIHPNDEGSHPCWMLNVESPKHTSNLASSWRLFNAAMGVQPKVEVVDNEPESLRFRVTFVGTIVQLSKFEGTNPEQWTGKVEFAGKFLCPRNGSLQDARDISVLSELPPTHVINGFRQPQGTIHGLVGEILFYSQGVSISQIPGFRSLKTVVSGLSSQGTMLDSLVWDQNDILTRFKEFRALSSGAYGLEDSPDTDSDIAAWSCLSGIGARDTRYLSRDLLHRSEQITVHNADILNQAIYNICNHHACLITPSASLPDKFRKRFVGYIPEGGRIGDEIVMIHGFSMPMLIRKLDQDRYRFQGVSYVHGVMDGELFQDGHTTEDIIVI